MVKPLSPQFYRDIHLSLLQLQTALTYQHKAYQAQIFPLYVALSQFEDTQLEEFFDATFPNRQFPSTLNDTAGGQFLSGVNTIDALMQPVKEDPSAYGFSPRHRQMIAGIVGLNTVVKSQLNGFAELDSAVDTDHLVNNLSMLADAIDKKQFTMLWNRFVAAVSVQKEQSFTPAFKELADFLSQVLTFDGHYSAASAAKFKKLYEATEDQLTPLTDTQSYFLSTQLTDNQQIEETQRPLLDLIINRNHVFMPLMREQSFDIPEVISERRELENILSTNDTLAGNITFVTALYRACREQPELQLYLLNKTLGDNEVLRRQCKVNQSREAFAREIHIDHWLRDVLILFCKLAFENAADEQLTDLTRFTFNIDKQDLSGIEKIYAVINQIVKAKILDTPAGEIFKNKLQLIPGLEKLEQWDSRSVASALQDFRHGIPYKYLVTSYRPMVYDIKQLQDFAADCADPSIAERCTALSKQWSELSSAEQNKIHQSVVDDFLANAPHAMMQKHYPEGVPNNKTFALVKLCEWFRGCHQNNYEATEAQHFFDKSETLSKPAASPIALSADHRDAYRQLRHAKAEPKPEVMADFSF